MTAGRGSSNFEGRSLTNPPKNATSRPARRDFRRFIGNARARTSRSSFPHLTASRRPGNVWPRVFRAVGLLEIPSMRSRSLRLVASARVFHDEAAAVVQRFATASRLRVVSLLKGAESITGMRASAIGPSRVCGASRRACVLPCSLGRFGASVLRAVTALCRGSAAGQRRCGALGCESNAANTGQFCAQYSTLRFCAGIEVPDSQRVAR